MKIVAVTACPTGIAHTYMAAEALEQGAKERGHDIAVETQGSSGIEEALSDDQIAQADGVIFAVDTGVTQRERFAHLPQVEVPTNDAINRAGGVFERLERAAAAEDGSTERARPQHAAATDGGAPASEPATSAKGGSLRQWLMTGVSYMIPFVSAGGILIALAFLLGDTVTVTDSNVYESFSIPALLFEIGNTAFSMLGPILAGFIAYAMADRPGIAPGIVGGLLATSDEIGAGFLGALVAGLLAGAVVRAMKKVSVPAGFRGLLPVLVWPLLGTLIVGALMILVIGPPLAALSDALTSALEGLSGANAILLGVILGLMMAFDMGGPVNKVAYTFALGLLAAGVLRPQAAVMAAGMTPPLGLALATALRPKLFSQPEREAGKSNWVLGASFITEGAIPFAAADPLRVIPACMLGSAVTGGLVMAFGNELQAPHGGVFVFGLVTNWPLYLLAVVVGTIVTGIAVMVTKSVGRQPSEARGHAAEPEAARA